MPQSVLLNRREGLRHVLHVVVIEAGNADTAVRHSVDAVFLLQALNLFRGEAVKENMPS